MFVLVQLQQICARFNDIPDSNYALFGTDSEIMTYAGSLKSADCFVSSANFELLVLLWINVRRPVCNPKTVGLNPPRTGAHR